MSLRLGGFLESVFYFSNGPSPKPVLKVRLTAEGVVPESGDAVSQGCSTVRLKPVGKAAVRDDLEKQLTELVERWENLEGQAQAASKQMRAIQRQISDADARTVIEQLEAAKTAVSGDPVVAKERLALASAALDKWERHLAVRGAIAGKTSVKAKP